MSNEHLHRLSAQVEALDERGALESARAALQAGAESLEVVSAAEQGMRGVGERYERQEIFLSGLIMAGEIFRGIVEVVQPSLPGEVRPGSSGRVLLGTVAGDIHDIGKGMAALMLRAHGFTVRDLGVNVPASRFLEAVEEFRPQIVGMSGLVTASFESMRQTVALLRKRAQELSRGLVIVVGGATMDEEVAAHIGADFWTTDAMQGVRICQHVMQET